VTFLFYQLQKYDDYCGVGSYDISGILLCCNNDHKNNSWMSEVPRRERRKAPETGIWLNIFCLF